MNATHGIPVCVGTGSKVLRILQGLLLVLFLLESVPITGKAIPPLASSSMGQVSAPGGGPEAPMGQAVHPTPSLPDARIRRGVLPFVTILCKFPDVPGEPESPAFFERLLGASYPGLDNYWRTASYGAISLTGSTVVGWYSMPHGSDVYRIGHRDVHTDDSMVTADLQRLAEDCTAAVDRPTDWAHYFGINLVFNADLDRPRGGQMCLVRGGVDKCYGATWIWASKATDQALWAHEMGHSFGLRHSSLGLGATNDNIWDAMSDRGVCGYDREYHHIAQDPIAYDKDLLGWIPASRKFVAAPNSVATIMLERLATPGADGYLLAQIPIPGDDSSAPGSSTRFYTVEARQRAGYDANLPGEAVAIHEVDTGRESPARPMAAQQYGRASTDGMSYSSVMWTSGSIFRDSEHGIAVAVEQATPTGFVVTIATRHLPWPLAPRSQSVVPAGSVLFAWEPVPDAVSYQLEITFVTKQPSQASVTEAATSASHRVVLAPGIYRWRVRALSAAGPQPWTICWELTVGHLRPVMGADPAVRPDPSPPGAHGRVITAVDPRGGMYAIWAAPNDDLQGSTGLTPGGGAGTDIYVSYHAAGGNWGSQVKINDDPGIFHSSPAITTDGVGNAYAVWIASSRPGYDADIYFAYRQDSAAEAAKNGWSASVRVNDNQDQAARMYPALTVDAQGNAYATWIDGREGHAAVYFSHYPTAAANSATAEWSANTKISGDPQTAFSPPSIVADAQGNVYLAWQQGRWCNGVDIYFAGRTAAGAWGSATRITPNPTGQVLRLKALVADSSRAIYATWQEDGGPRVELYAAACGSNCGLPVAEASAWGHAVWIGQDADPRSAPASHIRVDGLGAACVAWPNVTGQAGCLELSPSPVREHAAAQTGGFSTSSLPGSVALIHPI